MVPFGYAIRLYNNFWVQGKFIPKTYNTHWILAIPGESSYNKRKKGISTSFDIRSISLYAAKTMAFNR